MEKFGYVRVSRDDQSLANQVQALEREGVDPTNIYTDTVTGISDLSTRPGFMDLSARLNAIDGESVVYVFELSRLGRSFVNTLTILHDWEARGIHVWSLSPSEGWSRIHDQHIRDLVLSFYAWVAQHERATLIERTKLGLERARAEGKPLGRPHRQIPWSRVDSLQDKHISLAAISRILDIPYSTLYAHHRRRTNATPSTSPSKKE